LIGDRRIKLSDWEERKIRRKKNENEREVRSIKGKRIAGRK
jgi:hypothetical protein